MSATRSSRLRVVVDGSNLATEGRTIPSLVQLDEAVRAFVEENPVAEVIVVVDASFEHRVASGERARFKEAELAGEIVTPPAGAIGRGDAFILKIAQRINAVVLSNDSFQEFHDEYPWLFDADRLIGGKPVKGVGWVFTPRNPVRGAKSSRPVKKLSVTLAHGAKPTIGTTLTPVKEPRATVKKAAVKAAPVVKKARKAVKAAEAPAKRVEAVSKAVEKHTEPVKHVVAAEKVAAEKSVEAPAKRPAKKAAPAKKTVAAKAATLVRRATKVTKAPKAVPAIVEVPVVEPTPALRRGRHPVNPEDEFALFTSSHKIGSKVEGEVSAFTSHGAIIKVTLKNGKLVECYAPTTALGTPAPARARDVLKRGDRKTFRLLTVDTERRIAELGMS